MHRWIRTACAVVTLFSAAMPVLAQEARVVYLEGDVTVQSGGETESARIGTEMREGDLVETGPGATAIIDLGSGAEIKLRGNTAARIEELRAEDGVDVGLERGGFFALVRRAIRGGFRVSTGTVVAGVRGTQFFVAFGRTVEDRADVWLCVNEGTVDVEVPETGERTEVREGEGINILAGTRLTGAQPYDWTRDLNWNMDPDAGEVEDDTDLDEAYADLLDQDYD